MRILFVCFPYSVHAARWIGLLRDTGWDLHLFPSQEFDSLHTQFAGITYWPAQPRSFKAPEGIHLQVHSAALRARAAEGISHADYLARVIAEGGFDIVHSMEFQHAGYLTHNAFKRVLTRDALQRVTGREPAWIATNYGSDIYLYRHEPEHAGRIRAILEHCDYYAAECARDVTLAKDMGFTGKIFALCPNGGGIDMREIAALRSSTPTSWRNVIAIKGYEHFAGRAVTVLGVIEDLAASLRGRRIVVYAPSPDTREAADAIRARTGLDIECTADQEPHATVLALHGRSRISIANSISDGISTSLLEAMAMGAFPIQSCTSCGDEWIRHGETGFLTEPNDPATIKAALLAALQDDALVDRAAIANLAVIRERADSRNILAQVVAAYSAVTGQAAAEAPDSVPASPAPGRPVLSVITPTFNRAGFLPETISSVLSQSFQDFEYLIIDDGSKDDTQAVVAGFNDPRIRYLRHNNIGETRTVNRALHLLNGAYFTIVNSDDPAVPGAFECLLAALEADPDALMAYPNWTIIDEASQPLSDVRLAEYDMQALLLSGTAGLGPGAMFRSDVIETVGLRNPLIRYAADLDYIFRLCLAGRIIHVPELLGTHRVHPGSASISDRNERLALETLELLRAYGAHPLLDHRLRRRARESFAVGAFAAAMVAPTPRMARRLLAKGFLSHPEAMLRRIHEHSAEGVIARLEEIGTARAPQFDVWFDRATGAETRLQAQHAAMRAMLGDPIGAMQRGRAAGFAAILRHIRHLRSVAPSRPPTPVAAQGPLPEPAEHPWLRVRGALRSAALTLPPIWRLQAALQRMRREQAELAALAASNAAERQRLFAKNGVH